MDDKLETRRLRYFMQVLESGSVRGAAEVLGMDASAVSRAVALLETECGARLLERRGRGVVPTDAGDLLASYLRRQQSQKQHLLAQLDSIRKIERGHIDIVAGEGFVDWLMRNSLRTFMQSHPRITIALDVGSSDEIVKRIVDERAHIGMLFQPPKDERLRSHHSHPQPIQTLVLASHPLTRLGRPLKLADLQAYPGATLHRGFGVRQHIEAAEISEGVRLNALLTTSSFSALGHFVAAGLGYALSTRLSLPAHLDTAEISALPMKNPLLHQGRTHVISRHGRVLSPAATELLRQIVSDTGASGDFQRGSNQPER
ncbi:LysR family transcriptional regulator [Variovorax sp. YR216]|uniref:LysR family transcriptional regulator n=1 Tax=Variovorax sp. YR216 TaxID=1882828 RepID=UPI00089D0C18|nr:LysR family transcriptional regulator [Variovorax sp. YR216]SEA04603.1 DNA-binding transcriptional regulator, LysR family [Variovorax sp. YR216]